MIYQILVPIAGTLLCYMVLYVVQFVYRDLTSPLRHVVGPKNPSLIVGNFRQMAADPHLTEKWRQEFGANFRFRSLFSISELHTSDIKAINHIVNNSSIYRKAAFSLESANRLMGRGVLGVELDEHKHHNPAFGVPQIRMMTEIFVEKAVQLRDIWAGQVLSWLRRMTLDVIGQAGFDYQFEALDVKGEPNELDQVFTQLFHSPQATRNQGFRVAQSMPLPGMKLLASARGKMLSIGGRIVSTSKANLDASEADKALGNRRDLLSVLLRANLSPDIPESQRLTDAEVIAQIPTFFVAGHETTSSATAWALHALSLNKAAQSKLREELLNMSTDNPTMDELNSLPYLEMVVREMMRVHAPVVFIQRMAMQDDVLPLSKPYIDKAGKSHASLPIPKGQVIHIPILAVNTDPEIWGPDAGEFKPERWEKVPDAATEIPGAWANLLSFFAGPHNCIGFRFSLVEMKALLFTLIRAFEFDPAVTKGGIGPSPSLLQRPRVIAEKGKGSQLPLIVKPYDAQGF
ncbi:cytochrome P450 [Mycena rosella]|uniref:Cytochrome P450 n=1 Tax=Mycena rosella TaxID=1033263 RepID=A0AAD7FQY9_MYCRO|nr:cytochrome P450 [Mycena rosella]